MTITKVLTPVAFVALLALTAAPAHAGQNRGGSSSRGGSRGGQARSSSGYRGAVRGGVVVRGGGGFVRGRSSFYRPYYSFWPRVSIGFGLWAGYPVAYPYYYDSPYRYDDPYAYGGVAPSYSYPAQPYQAQPYSAQPYGAPNQSSAYPPSSYPAQRPAPSVGVQRGGQQSEGGISFEITPENAAVFVDGTYMGTAGEFGPDARPLDLRGGRHHVEVRASGYRTMTFDADVQPGQVIPYQGTLQRN